MKLEKLVLGLLETNTYVVVSEQKNAVVIDPADKGKTIADDLKQLGISVKKILLTHGHFDHTKGCMALKAETNADIYVHENDNWKLIDIRKALPFPILEHEFVPTVADYFVKDGDVLHLDELDFTVIYTPGHTNGGVTYRCGQYLFTGDTLFQGTIGATADKTANITDLLNSVKRLAALPGDYIVLPGHGEETTMEAERKYNAYL